MKSDTFINFGLHWLVFFSSLWVLYG